MGEYEDQAIELGAVKRLVAKQQGETIILLELLRRSKDALVAEDAYHSGLLDYDLLVDITEELSHWKTERD